MKGLEPSTVYSYKVGDPDSGLWSKAQTFTTPPAPRKYNVDGSSSSSSSSGGLAADDPTSSVRFAVLADMSSAEIDGSLQPGYFSNDFASLNTSRSLIRQVRAGEVDFALCVGDLSYASGYVGRWDTWMDQIEPVSRNLAFMVGKPSTTSLVLIIGHIDIQGH